MIKIFSSLEQFRFQNGLPKSVCFIGNSDSEKQTSSQTENITFNTADNSDVSNSTVSKEQVNISGSTGTTVTTSDFGSIDRAFDAAERFSAANEKFGSSALQAIVDAQNNAQSASSVATNKALGLAEKLAASDSTQDKSQFVILIGIVAAAAVAFMVFKK